MFDRLFWEFSQNSEHRQPTYVRGEGGFSRKAKNPCLSPCFLLRDSRGSFKAIAERRSCFHENVGMSDTWSEKDATHPFGVGFLSAAHVQVLSVVSSNSQMENKVDELA